jgi:rhodanese-related sulfurtransferase
VQSSRAWFPLVVAGALLAAADPPFALAFEERTPVETRHVAVDGGGRYIDVSPAGFATMLEGKAFPLINVHIPYEGEIPGTDAFVPFDEIGAHVDKLPSDRRARVVLYCRSGHMSAIAAQALVKLGYTDVWNLDGGMIAWQKAGHALAQRAR